MKIIFNNFSLLNNLEYEENFQKIESYPSHKEMDHWLVTKIHPEFLDADHYYTLSSSKNDIKNLKVRTIFFNAKDDLLSPVDFVDLKDSKKLFLEISYLMFSIISRNI